MTNPKGYATTEQVRGWPEFRAFVKRLGIPVDKATQNLEIHLAIDSVVVVLHTYVAKDKTPETTTEVLIE